MANVIINIDVNDLERAIAFYREAIGLTVARRFGEWGVELAGAASAIFLLVKSEGTKPSTTTDDLRRYRRHWTPVHLDFVVSDLDAALKRAIAAGAILEIDPATYRWGRIAQLADPFGHGLCLIQFLGRGYDEIADA